MYYSWIPNVSGYLSFTHIGGIKIRHRVMPGELIKPPTKFLNGNPSISILQERNLSDRPAVGSINSNTEPGRHFFLLQASLSNTANGRALAGVVISVPSVFKTVLQEVHSHFNSAVVIDQTVLTNVYSQLLASICARTLNGCFGLSFTLSEDGVITFTSLVNASPTDPEGPLLAFEAYSFVKDLVHKHRFHSSSDDALLELTTTNSSNSQWFESVIRNLHRSIISSFRSPSKLSLSNALGKLTYLESFLQVLKKRNIHPQTVIATSTLREALLHHQTCGQEEKDQRQLFTSYGLAMLAIALPLLFVCLQLLQIPCIDGISYETPKCATKFLIPASVVNLSSFVLKYLDYTMIAAVVLFAITILGFWWNHVYRYNETRTTEGKWTGDLRELLLRMGISHRKAAKWIVVLIALLLVCGTATGVFYLLKP